MNQNELLDDVGETVSDKNDEYSDSWRKTAVIKRVIADEGGINTTKIGKENIVLVEDSKMLVMHELDADLFKETNEVEFVKLSDTPEQTSLFEETFDGTFSRLLDKVVRSYHIAMVKSDATVENESLLDSLKDLVGYASLLGSLVSERE
jgi:hypothetical protein